MRHFFGLIDRFRSDERGVFAIMFGLIAIVLVAMAGAVVDFVSLQQARTRAQVALDSATLALQPDIFKDGMTNESIRSRAEALLVERINDARIGAVIDGIQTDTVEGSLFLQARLEVPTIFVALVGVNQLNARLSAEATRKKLALEVAMVLDISTSMGQQNRMPNLKSAATCATNIIFYGEVNNNNCNPLGGAVKQENTKIAVVPFNMLVNIGTNNQNQAWLDWYGTAPISRENFHTDPGEGYPYNTSPNRLTLFQSTGENWRGCVLAREAPHDVRDTAPNAGSPETLFTPFFAPDEPDRSPWTNSYISDTRSACTVRTCTVHETRTATTTTDRRGNKTTTYGNWTRRSSQPYTQRIGNTSTNSSSSCLTGGPQLQITYTGNQSTSTARQVIYSLLSNRQLQERLCKYTGTNTPRSINNNNIPQRGPNANCSTLAILPLTDNDANVRSRINAMSPDGYTNIHQGAMWGFHVLSPTPPFIEADEYDLATSKVMILMTDGENYNTWRSYGTDPINGVQVYGAYGYRYHHEYGGTATTSNNQLVAMMNAKTVATCASAKAEGIVIYTIGLSSPNNATTQMLTDCATSASYAYFPNNPSLLNDIFRDIADQLTRLRLAR